MDDIYNRNLEQLRARFPDAVEKLERSEREDQPEFQVIAVPGDNPNLILSDQTGQSHFFHNLEDPVGEARSIVRELEREGNLEAFFVLGFGAGYHIEALLEKLHPEIPVIIVEKDVSIMREALSLRDYSSIWSRKKLYLALDESPYEASFDALCRFYNISPRPGFQILTVRRFRYIFHHLSFERFKGYYSEVVEQLDRITATAGDNIETFFCFIDLWGENITANAAEFVFNPGVITLKDVFKGIPAVVIAAGPSLDRAAPFLKKIQTRSVLIAVDTAMRTLETNDVHPHFVMSIDGQDLNMKHYEGVDAAKTFLVTDPVTWPGIVQKFSDRVFMCTSGHPLGVYLEGVMGDRGFLPGSGSVATNCLRLALLLGCDPIVFVGQDLAYQGWSTHSKNSGYSDFRLGSLNRFMTMASGIRAFKESSVETWVKGNYSDKVGTSRVMKRWIEWIARAISENPDRTFINTSDFGAYIEGTELESIDSLAERLPDIHLDVRGKIETLYRKGDHTDVAGLIRQLRQDIDTMKQVSRVARRALKELARTTIGPREEQKKIIRVNRLAKEITGNEKFMRLSQWDVEPLVTDLMEQNENIQSGGFQEKAFKQLFAGVREIADKFATRLGSIFEKVNRDRIQKG